MNNERSGYRKEHIALRKRTRSAIRFARLEFMRIKNNILENYEKELSDLKKKHNINN